MELEGISEIEVEIKESGPQGPPGLSAYEVYLKNGGTLSETEWLESLKGETGGPGADGKDGIDGKDGQNGADGKDGYTPVKGVDYFTEEDINEVLSNVVLTESDPTVPAHVKAITEEDIAKWNEGGGSNISGEVMAEMAVYSTEEIIVGTWIDGKPLYRKVVSTTEVMQENVNLVVPHGITDIEKIWIDFGNSYYYRADDKRGLTLVQTFYTTTQSQDRTSAYVDENNVHLISTGGWNENWEKVITLNYTKTTDEPVNSLTYYPITKEYVDEAISAAITSVLEGEY